MKPLPTGGTNSFESGLQPPPGGEIQKTLQPFLELIKSFACEANHLQDSSSNQSSS